MVRRSTPKKQIDEHAFPVRVKVRVPPRGHGINSDLHHRWLNENAGSGQFAIHGATTRGGSATAFYFRSLDKAQEFIASFPALELADGTYALPAVSVSADEWTSSELFGVCNLYRMTSAQSAIRALFDGITDTTGNLPPLESIYPDYPAPVIHHANDGPAMSMMRWGMPSPAFALKGKKTDRGVTNVRNTKSPHWRRWLGVRNRCVVPFTSFAEPHKPLSQPSENVWFELGDDQIGFFAGIWTEWTSVRKLKDGETTDDLFAFLTTEANEEVAAVHPKAMPVILRTTEELNTWLRGTSDEALALQRPLPSGSLQRLDM